MLKARLKSKASPKGGKEQAPTALDRELPYVITLITLMASSGITPYQSFKRLCHMEALPETRKEAASIVRQVEVLGSDPLSVMQKKAENTKSKTFRDLLVGYVTTVRSGGSITSFLKSKMHAVFDLQAALAKQTVEKLGTLVEAYMIILVLTLLIYVFAINTSLPVEFLPKPPTIFIYLIIFVAIPMFLVLFMIMAHRLWRGNLLGTERILKQHIPQMVGVAVGVLSLNFFLPLEAVTGLVPLPYILAGGLLAVAIRPALTFQKIVNLNTDAEAAMPSFLRDIAEGRKTGLSPEKCIIMAATRKGYGRFTEHLQRVANQLAWGIPLRRIVADLRKKILSWPVLVYFHILVEVVETGGAHADTLDMLAESSEKLRNVDAERMNLLKPYVMLPFMVIGLFAFITILMIQTLTSLPLPSSLTAESASSIVAVDSEFLQPFMFGIILHAWITGFFTGKVTLGNSAAGFRFSALLVLTAVIGLVISSMVTPFFTLG